MPKQARVLVVGGGVAAAHVAQALCDRQEELPETDKALCTILSAYPAGIALTTDLESRRTRWTVPG